MIDESTREQLIDEFLRVRIFHRDGNTILEITKAAFAPSFHDCLSQRALVGIAAVRKPGLVNFFLVSRSEGELSCVDKLLAKGVSLVAKTSGIHSWESLEQPYVLLLPPAKSLLSSA